jgi:hypothetical protein
MTRTYTPVKRADDYSLLRAEWEFLASACSNALWGDDRYRDMRRKDFLIAISKELRPPEPPSQQIFDPARIPVRRRR